MCGIKQDYQLTVQCDECTKWYHTYCLKPPLTEMPDENDDWYDKEYILKNLDFSQVDFIFILILGIVQSAIMKIIVLKQEGNLRKDLR